MKKFIFKSVFTLIVMSIIMSGLSVEAFSSKQIKVLINAVSIKVNGETSKIDNFSYSGKIYVQPQDICSLLAKQYKYDKKTKTIDIKGIAPNKTIAKAKLKFYGYKSSTAKTIKVSVNETTIKINEKALKTVRFNFNGAVFVQSEDFCKLLNENYVYDAKKKTLTITEKKPTTPKLTADIPDPTKSDVKVTIDNWGDAKVKEYRIDNGKWTKYTSPVVMSANGSVSARGTNSNGNVSEVGNYTVDNILIKLSVEEIGQKSKAVVLINVYNANNTIMATGSGFIISDDGRIVTNYHVIDKAAKMEIVMNSGKKYSVSGVLNYSVEKDIAVLKIETEDVLPYLSLGDSEELKLGESIVAIGSPYGLQNTISTGIVSSFRADVMRTGYTDIQITAPISSGSSGGCLFNLYGEVVGITYAGYVEGQNLNFAIPINDLTPMLTSLQLKTLNEVRKEVYPSMSYKEFETYLYDNYSTNFAVGGYKFNFDDIYIIDSISEVGYVYCYIYLYPASFDTVYSAMENNAQKDVEAWMGQIINELTSQYHGKKFRTVFLYDAIYDADPTGDFPPEDIYYDQIGKTWEVITSILIGNYEGTSITYKWDWVLE